MLNYMHDPVLHASLLLLFPGIEPDPQFGIRMLQSFLLLIF